MGSPYPSSTVKYDVTGVSNTHTWSEPASEPEALPARVWLTATQQALQQSAAAQRLLERERGISWRTARRYGIGLTRDERHPSGRIISAAWTIPIYDGTRQWVNVVWRPVGRVARPWRLAGRTIPRGHLPLYPDVPKRGPILLVAGEFDALIGRQHGVPAMTGLLGATWYAAWNKQIVGRRIAVLFDRGEERQAATAVEALRRGGAAQAWSVSWAGYRDDLPDGYDLGDYLMAGHTAEDVFELVRQVRP